MHDLEYHLQNGERRDTTFIKFSIIISLQCGLTLNKLIAAVVQMKFLPSFFFNKMESYLQFNSWPNLICLVFIFLGIHPSQFYIFL